MPANTNRLQEELAWWRIVFAVVAAIDVSAVGWLAQHYAAVALELNRVAALLILLDTLGIIVIARLR